MKGHYTMTKTPRQRLAEAYGAEPEKTMSNRRLVTQAALYRPDAAFDAALELRRTDAALYRKYFSGLQRQTHAYYELAKQAAEQLER
jgi:hypothetical protein